jgi:hypothetical protein
MTLLASADLVGIQQPRVWFAPPTVVSTEAAIETEELCAAAGLDLDEWQTHALRLMLGEKDDGDWAAFEFGFQAQRQNGKGGVLEARELGGLFLFGERDIIHSAHAADTAHKAYLRMRNLIDGASFLSKRVKRMPGSPGQEYVELMDGRMLEYRTRTSSGGRGFSGTPVILDEAQELSASELAAIMPVVSAQPNPQMIYTGTVKVGAAVFQGVRTRGRDRVGDALGWAEWSAAEDADSDDVEAHRAANPAMGIRIAPAYIRNELQAFRGALAEDEWRMERLGIWPEAGGVGTVIPLDAWASAATDWRPRFDTEGGVVGVAINMARSYASIGYAVPHPDGTYVEEIAWTGKVDKASGQVFDGIDWVLPYLAGLVERRKPTNIILDKVGPAGSLLNAMIASRFPLRVAEFQDWKAACNQFVDAMVTGRVKHPGDQVLLTESAQGVQWRLVGENRVYNRKTAGINVAPVEAVTLAAWGLNPDPKAKEFFVMNLNDFMGDE